MRGSYSMGQPTQAGPPAASVGPLDPGDDRGAQLFTSPPAARKADPTDPLWITAMTQASNARKGAGAKSRSSTAYENVLALHAHPGAQRDFRTLKRTPPNSVTQRSPTRPRGRSVVRFYRIP